MTQRKAGELGVVGWKLGVVLFRCETLENTLVYHVIELGIERTQRQMWSREDIGIFGEGGREVEKRRRVERTILTVMGVDS